VPSTLAPSSIADSFLEGHIVSSGPDGTKFNRRQLRSTADSFLEGHIASSCVDGTKLDMIQPPTAS
jgi:hypothetical protein